MSFPPLDQSRCLLRQGQARKPQPRRGPGEHLGEAEPLTRPDKRRYRAPGQETPAPVASRRVRGLGQAPVHLFVAVGRMGAGRASAPLTGACAREGRAQRALDLSEEHLRTQTKEHGLTVGAQVLCVRDRYPNGLRQLVGLVAKQ